MVRVPARTADRFTRKGSDYRLGGSAEKEVFEWGLRTPFFLLFRPFGVEGGSHVLIRGGPHSSPGNPGQEPEEEAATTLTAS